MTDKDIKFKTIQYMNGIKYLNKQQVFQLQSYICYVYNLEQNEINFKAIQEGIDFYFGLQTEIIHDQQ
jgi:hypothetical protein